MRSRIARSSTRPERPTSRPRNRFCGDGQVLGEKDLLVHEHDPLVLGLDRARERNRRIIEEQAPLAGRQVAGEDAHERRLAGAVLADHRVDLARLRARATRRSGPRWARRISRRALREVRPWNHPARVQHRISRPRAGWGGRARFAPGRRSGDRDGGSHRVSSSNVASPSAERTGPPVSLDGRVCNRLH